MSHDKSDTILGPICNLEIWASPWVTVHIKYPVMGDAKQLHFSTCGAISSFSEVWLMRVVVLWTPCCFLNQKELRETHFHVTSAMLTLFCDNQQHGPNVFNYADARPLLKLPKTSKVVLLWNSSYFIINTWQICSLTVSLTLYNAFYSFKLLPRILDKHVF